MGRTESWIYFWSTLGAALVLCVAKERFTVSLNPVVFDKALEACRPAGGFLANIANATEVSEILEIVSNALKDTQNAQEGVSDTLRTTRTFHFWIGLKNGRNDCVIKDEPLRGFKWSVDVGSDPEVGRWKEEPEQTCTGTLCALLSAEFNGTVAADWGLVPSSCQKAHAFLCRKGEDEVPKASCPPISVPEARSQRTEPDGKQLVECFTGEIHTLSCSADARGWILADGSAADGGLCPACRAGFERDESGGCVDVDECAKQANLCKHLCTNVDGSFVCQCLDQLGNVHDEGSSACGELTTAAATPTEGTDPQVIQVSAPTTKAAVLGRPSPSSPPASLAPPPSSPTDSSQVEVQGQANSVFIPVLIAVMALVVLVVVVLAVVKCCLRRRSQQLAMKKAEKMAMKRAEDAKEDKFNGQDSMERTNEKEAT